MVVNANHIYGYDPDLYYKLVCYPAEIISLFDRIVNEIFREHFVPAHLAPTFDKSILTTYINLRRTTHIREINYQEINRLISIKGLVIRASDIYPEMKLPFFKCVVCKHLVPEVIDRGRIKEPVVCGKCGGKNTFDLAHNLCSFTDKQFVKLQEMQSSVPEGGLPAHVNLIVYDDLVDCCRPGDAVEIVGIFRALPTRVHRHQTLLHSTFRSYVDVVSITCLQDNRVVVDNELTVDKEKMQFCEAEVAEFKEFAADPRVYQMLEQALAPSVWEMEDVKKGLLCQLFGGTPKNFASSFRARFRHELNVLLIGDPSTAKSQLL